MIDFTCVVIFLTCPSLIKTEFNYYETSKSEENTKKYLTERYLDRINVPVMPGSKSYIRSTMVDEELQKWTLRQTNSILSYILNEKNDNPFEKYPENANKIIEIEKCFTCPLASFIYSERGCHMI